MPTTHIHQDKILTALTMVSRSLRRAREGLNHDKVCQMMAAADDLLDLLNGETITVGDRVTIPVSVPVA